MPWLLEMVLKAEPILSREVVQCNQCNSKAPNIYDPYFSYYNKLINYKCFVHTKINEFLLLMFYIKLKVQYYLFQFFEQKKYVLAFFFLCTFEFEWQVFKVQVFIFFCFVFIVFFCFKVNVRGNQRGVRNKRNTHTHTNNKKNHHRI